MPPVFGPSSPSRRRLKSWAGASARASSPAQRAKSETSSPSSSSSTTTRPPRASAFGSAAATSSSVRQTKTPFPGGEPVGLDDARGPGLLELRRRGDARCLHDLLREGLGAFDLGRRRARAEDGDAGVAEVVGEPGDERRLRPDDDEVDAELVAEPEQRLRVVRPERVAGAEAGDARVAGGGVQVAEPRALGDLPRERVLAPARADDEDVHAGESNRGFGPPAKTASPRLRGEPYPLEPHRRGH